LFYMDAPLDYCKNNKPELYRLIEQGKTQNLPGIDLEYEAPIDAELVFHPKDNEENLDAILDYLAEKKVYPNH
ncbi:MAG: adenylyl-sulfate kinase, partial [Draconibacterium sp.]|nr:adenylyl-sulfate kinase [Draconibacterium sp.]